MIGKILETINEEQNLRNFIKNIFLLSQEPKTKTDEYKSDTWLEPWQLIERNEYNEFDLSLLLCYTIMITEQFKDRRIVIHNCFIAKEIESQQP